MCSSDLSMTTSYNLGFRSSTGKGLERYNNAGCKLPTMFRGDRLAAIMEDRRISQSELARRVGVSQASIWKLVKQPSQGTKHLHKIAAELGTTAEYLLGESYITRAAHPRPSESLREPERQTISLQVSLPSEAALRDMFRSILVLVPEGASKDEAADILARRLPAGLASIGPLALDPNSAASLATGEAPPAPAKDRPASGPSSHT